MIVIGLSGKAEHGKTTAANYVRPELEKLGFKTDIVPLAKRMKEQAKMLGWDGEKNEKGRRLLQEISWPIKHYFGEDIYARWCLEQAQEAGLDILLIDDVRMLAEIEYFRRAKDTGLIDDFQLIRVARPYYKSKLTEKQLADVSETQLDSYDFNCYCINNGTIDEFGETVMKEIKTMLKIKEML